MAKWMSSSAERLRRRIGWALAAGWLVAALAFWSRYQARFYSPAGAPLVQRMAAAAVALLAAIWITVKLLGFVFGWIYGFRYTELDMDRYNRAVVTDVKRKEDIDRSLHKR